MVKVMIEYRELDFLGFPGYKVGDDGTIWSRHCNSGKLKQTWKRLKPWTVRGGYLTIGLNVNKKRHYRSVHRLILEVFVGPCPEKMEACHQNSNPKDNRPENLRWDTPKNNCKERGERGEWQKNLPRGEKHHNSKLTEKQVKEIRSIYSPENNPSRKLAKIFKVDKSVILDIINYKIWRHI